MKISCTEKEKRTLESWFEDACGYYDTEACGCISECGKCSLKTVEWEIIPEPVDWSKVEVDTPILVRNRDGDVWARRYFEKCEDGKIYAWTNGTTSWTAGTKSTEWKYAKLADKE